MHRGRSLASASALCPIAAAGLPLLHLGPGVVLLILGHGPVSLLLRREVDAALGDVSSLDRPQERRASHSVEKDVTLRGAAAENAHSPKITLEPDPRRNARQNAAITFALYS